jgi:drug/metabolite transporter (DMT)-like permease
METRAKKQRWLAYLFLIINTICWGAALVLVKPAFDYTTPYRFLFYRYLFASFLFGLPYLWVKRKKLNKKILITVVGIELLGTVLNLTILYIGLSLTSAIEASLIGTAGPVFITLAGIIFLKERQEKCEWLGLSLSLLGTILIVLTNHYQTEQISLTGNLLVVAYNLLNALYLILAKKHYHQIDKKLVGAISFVTGLIAFGIIVAFNQQFQLEALFNLIQQEWQHRPVLLASLYMAIPGSVIGLISYIEGQDRIEASEASLFVYLQPLIYLPLGLILLQEKIFIQQLVGLGLILLGVIVAEKRRGKKR